MYLCARFSTMKSKIIHKGHGIIKHILCLHTTHTSRYYWRQPWIYLGRCRGFLYWPTSWPNLKYPCWAGKEPTAKQGYFLYNPFSLTMCERRPVHNCLTQCWRRSIVMHRAPGFLLRYNEYEANKLSNNDTKALLPDCYCTFLWPSNPGRHHRRKQSNSTALFLHQGMEEWANPPMAYRQAFDEPSREPSLDTYELPLWERFGLRIRLQTFDDCQSAARNRWFMHHQFV